MCSVRGFVEGFVVLKKKLPSITKYFKRSQKLFVFYVPFLDMSVEFLTS